jgi:DNA-binding transcriptional LysR family regulator
MEMHQVRYFLAVARLLNFTRAAEEYNVAQPSLTRAIKQLGGELFRRERNLTHVSELGQRMVPLMQKILDSTQTAKQVASSINRGALAPLSVALPETVNIELVLPFLKELVRAMPGLTLKFVRGSSADIVEHLKNGSVDVAIGSHLPETWDRIESWPLFTEAYRLVASKSHRFGGKGLVSPNDLAEEKLVCRPYCEAFERAGSFLSEQGIDTATAHNAGSDRDFVALLAAELGVGFAPRSSATSPDLTTLEVEGFHMDRTVYAYAVAGRRRSVSDPEGQTRHANPNDAPRPARSHRRARAARWRSHVSATRRGSP